MSTDASSVLIDGPWQHRFVSANGARFHVAEQGEGPLVLLLHGFPQFWWAWRHQMPALADAGYRVAAMDLRGYGASDKPPRGYDTFTLAADVASVIRSLGEKRRRRRRPRLGRLDRLVDADPAARGDPRGRRRCRCRTRWSCAGPR